MVKKTKRLWTYMRQNGVDSRYLFLHMALVLSLALLIPKKRDKKNAQIVQTIPVHFFFNVRSIPQSYIESATASLILYMSLFPFCITYRFLLTLLALSLMKNCKNLKILSLCRGLIPPFSWNHRDFNYVQWI